VAERGLNLARIDLMHAPTLAALVAVCAAPRPAADAPLLRVVTYNILAGERGLENLTETLKSADADLIGLQEVDVGTKRSGGKDEAAALATALKMHHAFVPHFHYQGGQFGLALLSRHPIVRAERVRVKGSRLSLLDATVRTPKGWRRARRSRARRATTCRCWRASPGALRVADEHRLHSPPAPSRTETAPSPWRASHL
jgi:endonuclease/exonuclease/phosphatase family metal-dependent hydrolase